MDKPARAAGEAEPDDLKGLGIRGRPEENAKEESLSEIYVVFSHPRRISSKICSIVFSMETRMSNSVLERLRMKFSDWTGSTKMILSFRDYCVFYDLRKDTFGSEAPVQP